MIKSNGSEEGEKNPMYKELSNSKQKVIFTVGRDTIMLLRVRVRFELVVAMEGQ